MAPILLCIWTVLYLPCKTAKDLPGSGHPTCTFTENVLISAKVADLNTLPEQVLFEVESERKQTTDCVHPIEIVPASIRYPYCVVGHVKKKPTTVDGETIPGKDPYIGACCTPGCECASEQCEHIPFGGPKGYAEKRARRYE